MEALNFPLYEFGPIEMALFQAQMSEKISMPEIPEATLNLIAPSIPLSLASPPPLQIIPFSNSNPITYKPILIGLGIIVVTFIFVYAYHENQKEKTTLYQ